MTNRLVKDGVCVPRSEEGLQLNIIFIIDWYADYFLDESLSEEVLMYDLVFLLNLCIGQLVASLIIYT